MPVAIPELLPMVAMPGDAELQTPPPPLEGSLRVIDVPGQTKPAPNIVPGFGAGFTVATTVANALPQMFVVSYMIVAVP